MEVKKFRAKTMREALALVRKELGPEAAVLHTRDVRAEGVRGWLPGGRRIEVTASNQVAVPSRLPRTRPASGPVKSPAAPSQNNGPPAVKLVNTAPSPAPDHQARQAFRDELKGQLQDLHSMVEDLCRRSRQSAQPKLPESLFHLFTDLIEADLSEDLARELVERLRAELPAGELSDPLQLKRRLIRIVEQDIAVTGHLRSRPFQLPACRHRPGLRLPGRRPAGHAI